MKKLLCLSASALSIAASTASAGGWQTSALDSSFMYNSGNFAELSFGKVTYNVKVESAMGYDGYKDRGSKVTEDQNRMAFSFKTDVGAFSVGIQQYRYGSIQLQGGSATPGTGDWVPVADANIDTLALIGKWSATDNIDVLFGLTNNTLQSSSVSTIMGKYDISSASQTRPMIGAAYSIPDIALRIEAQFMPKTKMTTSTTFTEAAPSIPAAASIPAISYGDIVAASTVNPAIQTLAQSYGAALASGDTVVIGGFLKTDIGGGVKAGQALAATSGAVTSAADVDTDVVLPETIRLNFQTGIAKDTLLFGSIEHAKWGDAQIDVATGSDATAIATEFDNTTSYSIGIGRKLNEQWSISATYSKEPGTSSTSESLFTVSNGSDGVTLGARYTQGNMVVSGGVNYTRVGDVTVESDGTTLATYKGNTVTGIGVKVGFSF